MSKSLININGKLYSVVLEKRNAVNFFPNPEAYGTKEYPTVFVDSDFSVSACYSGQRSDGGSWHKFFELPDPAMYIVAAKQLLVGEDTLYAPDDAPYIFIGLSEL